MDLNQMLCANLSHAWNVICVYPDSSCNAVDLNRHIYPLLTFLIDVIIHAQARMTFQAATSRSRVPPSSSTYAILPVILFSPFFPSLASSFSSTASTSTGGFKDRECARFHRCNREIPMHGPYSEDRSKWRRIFSYRWTSFWWTMRELEIIDKV